MSFPVLLSALGLGVSYGIYAFFGVVAYFFVKVFVNETKGLSLEEISRSETEKVKAESAGVVSS